MFNSVRVGRALTILQLAALMTNTDFSVAASTSTWSSHISAIGFRDTFQVLSSLYDLTGHFESRSNQKGNSMLAVEERVLDLIEVHDEKCQMAPGLG